MSKRLRILFVTRKFPPSTGGMEQAAYELYTALSARNNVVLVKWGGSNALLSAVYVWLFLRALWLGLRRRPDVIYLQDGLMAPLGSLLKLLLKRPTLITIHGKEATYANPVYKLIVSPFVPRQNRLVAVSNETRRTVGRAFVGTQPAVIVNGLSDAFYTPDRTALRPLVAQAVGMPEQELAKHKLLYTNGRLIRRKGVRWFVDEVLPELIKANGPVLYVVSGEGKDRSAIEATIHKHGLNGRVFLLGRVSDELRQALYNLADVFVMPNIPLTSDWEGFGLVAVEAASCGATVVASDLEGIRDAIIDGKNGFLVEPKNASAYAKTIARELKQRTHSAKTVRDYTLAHYSWDETAQQYEAIMRELA